MEIVLPPENDWQILGFAERKLSCPTSVMRQIYVYKKEVQRQRGDRESQKYSSVDSSCFMHILLLGYKCMPLLTSQQL